MCLGHVDFFLTHLGLGGAEQATFSVCVVNRLRGGDGGLGGRSTAEIMKPVYRKGRGWKLDREWRKWEGAGEGREDRKEEEEWVTFST